MSEVIRDKIRKAAFKHSLKKDKFELNGQVIEIKQLAVGQLETLRDKAKTDSDLGYFSIVESCFVPGTDIKIFGEEDIEGMKKCPVGGWLTELIVKIGELAKGPEQVKKP